MNTTEEQTQAIRNLQTKFPELGDNLLLDKRMVYAIADKNYILEDDGEKLVEMQEINLLPDGLIVKGSLNISDSKIKRLPSKLIVTGNLVISRTDIEKLPEDMIIGGHINAFDSKLKHIPNDLIVCGNLNLSGTKIKELPEYLEVRGDLNISNTDIEKINEYNFVYGNLLAFNSKLKYLYTGFRCSELNLTGSDIKELPNNLSVQDLVISHTRIKTIPDDHKIKNLHVDNAKFIKSSGGFKISKSLLYDYRNVTVNKEGTGFMPHKPKPKKYLRISYNTISKTYSVNRTTTTDILKVDDLLIKDLTGISKYQKPLEFEQFKNDLSKFVKLCK